MFNYNNRVRAGKVATGSEQHVTANEASKTVTGPKVSASTEGERTLFLSCSSCLASCSASRVSEMYWHSMSM